MWKKYMLDASAIKKNRFVIWNNNMCYGNNPLVPTKDVLKAYKLIVWNVSFKVKKSWFSS